MSRAKKERKGMGSKGCERGEWRSMCQAEEWPMGRAGGQ